MQALPSFAARTGLVVALALALAALASTARAAAGPTVSIRIEGENGTVVPRTTVTTSTDPIAHGDACPGNTVAGAIEAATHGNWDGLSFTKTIAGETHPNPPDFSRSDYWSEWLNNKVGNGICSDVLQSGDDVLILTNFSGPAPNFAPTVFPLALEGVPAVALRGQAFTVTAVEYRSDATGTVGSGTRTPAAGVTVSGGGATAVTGADGTATLALPGTGAVSLQASTAHERSVPAAVCVHEPSDGGCGTTTAASPPAPDQPALPAADAAGPTATIAGIPVGRRFPAGRGPRLLKGTVDPDPSGLAGVYFRLWSHHRGRCYFYSGRSETLKRGRCGAHRELVYAGNRASWSYLLPLALPAGHYRVDAIAVDGRGNGSSITAGRNRVDFYVR